METSSFLAAHLAFFGAYTALVALVGAGALSLLERWGRGSEPLGRDGLERGITAMALGSGLVGQVVFVLGSLAALDPMVVALSLFGLAALGFVLARRGAEPFTLPRLFGTGRRQMVVAVGALLALPVLGLCLYPPTGFDTGLYHLPFAERFVEVGKLVFVPELRYPIFPQLAEMGFVLALLYVGDTAAAGPQTLALFLVAGLVFVWARPTDISEDGPKSRRTGAWAAALWLGTPLAVWIGSQAYVDVGLALHVSAGLFAWERWARSGEAGELRDTEGRDGRWLVLAGVQIGFAAATKYLGLFFLGVLGLATVAWVLLGRGDGGVETEAGSGLWPRCVRSLRAGLLFGLAFLAIAGPWYGRILAETGNPVFPFYTPLFGDNEWRHAHDDLLVGTASGSAEAAAEAGPADRTGTAAAVFGGQAGRAVSGLGFLLRTPWASLFDRDVFHRQAPLSPFFLLLLPWALPLAIFSPRARPGLLLILLYCLFWLTTERDIRFLFPILPLLGLCAAIGMERALGFLRGRNLGTWVDESWIQGFLILALVLPGPAYGVYKLWKKGPLPTTAEAREEHLARGLPGYSALAELRRLHGEDSVVYGLYVENLRHHAPGRFLGDAFGPHAFGRVIAYLEDGEGLYRELRSMDACHLVVRSTAGHMGAASWRMPDGPDFERRFRRLPFADSGPHPITGESFELYALRGFECPLPRP